MSDVSLHCEEEKDNKEYGKHTVAIIFDSFHSNKVVVHVSLYWSELVNHICVAVTDEIVNRGIGLELEIPFDYSFHGDNRVME